MASPRTLCAAVLASAGYLYNSLSNSLKKRQNMDADFWLERWREGVIPFHQSQVTPLLPRFWPLLAPPVGSRVLVPLCGKSLDMIWLAEQGLRVLGVELSQLAVEQFFAENGLHPVVEESTLGSHYVAGNIEIICGDIFQLDAATLHSCATVFDRAALIALPPAMRPRYMRHIYGQLPGHYQGLLITLEYPQAQMAGPPFSVSEEEVNTLCAGHSAAARLMRSDILAKSPQFAERGLTQLEAVVFRLQRSAA
jgi:thiopurine S-methyltransferase